MSHATVEPYEGTWGVLSLGTWCAAGAAAGKALEGITWPEAWVEVERLRAAHAPLNAS